MVVFLLEAKEDAVTARSGKTYFCLFIFTLVLFAGGILSGLLVAYADDQSTTIEVDNGDHVIRFFIEGKEMAVLDSAGMHVYGDLSYNGVLTDGTPLHLRQGGENDSNE